MSKGDQFTYESSDSENDSDDLSSDDDFMVVEDIQDSSDDAGADEYGLSDQIEEAYDENNDFGPWEDFTEDTYLRDVLPTFRKKYKAKSLFAHINEPIEFFNLFINNEFLEEVCTYSHKYYLKQRLSPI